MRRYGVAALHMLLDNWMRNEKPPDRFATTRPNRAVLRQIKSIPTTDLYCRCCADLHRSLRRGGIRTPHTGVFAIARFTAGFSLTDQEVVLSRAGVPGFTITGSEAHTFANQNLFQTPLGAFSPQRAMYW